MLLTFFFIRLKARREYARACECKTRSMNYGPIIIAEQHNMNIAYIGTYYIHGKILPGNMCCEFWITTLSAKPSSMYSHSVLEI